MTETISPRAVRLLFGFTQQQFADRLGVSIAAVHDWEQKGRIPSRRLQARIDALAATAIGKSEYIADTERQGA